jgi:hypothetical protein
MKPIIILFLATAAGAIAPSTGHGAAVPLRVRMMDDPRVRALTEELKRAELAANYEYFFTSRKIDNVARGKLIDALLGYEIEQENIRIERMAGPKSGSLTTVEAQSNAGRRGQAKAALLAAETAVFDAEGIAHWRQFERALPARLSVARFAGGATLLGMPLNAEDSERLTDLIAQACTPYVAGGKVELPAVDWSAVDAAAGKFLSAEQMEIFRATDLSLRWINAQSAALQTVLVTEAEANRPPPSTVDPEAVGRAFLAAHPELTELMMKVRLAAIRGQNLLLYQELRLKSADIAKFEHTLLDGAEGTMASLIWPRSTVKMTLRMGAASSSGEQAQRLITLLGREGYAKYMSGEFALAGGAAAEIAAALCFTASPLTTEQARRSARVLAEERQKGASVESRRAPQEYWTVVAARAREFLSTGQMVPLRTLQLRDELQAARRKAGRTRAPDRGPSKKP